MSQQGPPKRDKFAALAQQSSSDAFRRRDKFAALERRGDPVVVTHEQQQETQEQKLWKERMEQRQAIWKDMEQAEALTIKLLQLAQETATSLATTTTTTSTVDKNQVSSMANEFSQTLTRIHQCLLPHAAHVKAYTNPSRINRMYQARVELRLAQEKREIIQELLSLEQQQETMSETQKQQLLKRKREDS